MDEWNVHGMEKRNQKLRLVYLERQYTFDKAIDPPEYKELHNNLYRGPMWFVSE